MTAAAGRLLVSLMLLVATPWALEASAGSGAGAAGAAPEEPVGAGPHPAAAPEAPAREVGEVSVAGEGATREGATREGATQIGSPAAQALAAHLRQLEALHARFDQELVDSRGAVLRESRGELWAERPDRFRWEVATPFAEVLVGDGEQLWLWDPDLEQVTVRPYDERLQGTPALLLAGDVERLLGDFEVRRLGPDGDSERFELRPRQPSELFERLELAFDAGLPSSLVIHDALGQTTRVRLRDVETDITPQPGLFSFEVPAGADVLREETGAPGNAG